MSVRLSQYQGKQNIIHVEETSAENVPFTVENRCSELVIKLRQQGEAQCWLVNPGMSLHYTWDNCVMPHPQLEWTVYGSNQAPAPVKISQGKVGPHIQ